MVVQFSFLVAVVAACRAQTTLSYLDPGPGGRGCCVVEDAAGNIYAAAAVLRPGPPPHIALVVTKSDSVFRQVYSFTMDLKGDVFPGKIALDAQGSLFVGGETTAADFPLVNPLSRVYSTAANGFVFKLNSTGDRLLFSSYLGSQVWALVLDAAGSVYLTGYAQPCIATPTSYQAPDVMGTASCGFSAKLTNSGDRLVYAAAFNGSPRDLAVSPDGAVTVVGSTGDAGFPVTPGAFQTTCGCRGSRTITNGFVSRLSADGSSLQWSTFLGGTGGGGVMGDELSSVALAEDGGVVVTGMVFSPDFPTTPGAFQETIPGSPAVIVAAKLNSAGTKLVFSSRFGSSAEDQPTGIQLDSQDRLWITGYAYAPDVLALPGSLRLGNQFVVEMAPDASRLLLTQFLPNNTADGLLLDPAGYEVLFGENGSLLRFPIGGPSGPAILGEGNAIPTAMLGYVVSGIVAPGGIVSLYGAGLGPAAGVGAQLDSSGRFPTELAGTQVLFGGVPAPLLYAAANQVNAVVPFGVSSGSFTTVQIRSAAGTSEAVALRVVAADPAILAIPDASSGNYRSLLLNQDGSINSLSNPAQPGSIVTFWVSGAGLFQTSMEDGSIVEPPLPIPALPINVILDQYPTPLAVEVLYAGATPGMLAGILQVNIRIPPNAGPGSSGPIEIHVGNFLSYGSVAIQ
jgi:uncharacterized protein (TIGR03437 family)